MVRGSSPQCPGRRVFINFLDFIISFGYWHQRADERHGKPPQGNQELSVSGQRQSWKAPR